MSFVGPRPEVPRYVEMFREDYIEVLSVRPGITDLASLEYRHESELLAQAMDPEAEYCQRILPKKIELAKKYIRERSLVFDLWIMARTAAAIFRTKASEVQRSPTPAVTTGENPPNEPCLAEPALSDHRF
jgi:lipopolysaccharide/colanic/teichoic acid biosynthesis glycosyltransferase